MNRDWDQNKNHCLGESGPVSVRRRAYLDRGDAVKVTGGGERSCGHLVDLPVVLVWFPASHLTVWYLCSFCFFNVSSPPVLSTRCCHNVRQHLSPLKKERKGGKKRPIRPRVWCFMHLLALEQEKRIRRNVEWRDPSLTFLLLLFLKLR